MTPSVTVRLVGLLLLVILTLPSATAGPEPSETEQVRRRLLDAFRSQDRIHHAMRVTRVGESGKQIHVQAEVYLSGVTGGMRVQLHDDEVREFAMFATDGRVVAIRAPTTPSLVVEGVQTLRELHDPYEAVRERWRARWRRQIPSGLQWGISLQMALEGEGFEASLGVSSEPGPNWLTEEYLEDRRLTADETEGVAHMEGPAVCGTFRLRDGMPIAWKRPATPTTAEATGTVVPTEWTEDRWKAAIAERCKGLSPDRAVFSLRKVFSPLALLVNHAIRHGDDLVAAESAADESESEMQRVINEIAEVEIGVRPPDVEGGESVKVYVTRKHEEYDKLLLAAARGAGWSRPQIAYFYKRLYVTMAMRALDAGAVNDLRSKKH